MSFIPEEIKKINVADCICSPRHYSFFLNDSEIGKVINENLKFIREKGVSEYLKREYSSEPEKSIIINIISDNTEKKYYIVDGNRHLLAALLADPAVKLEKFKNLRIWESGRELKDKDTYVNNIPYVVYIPPETNTSRLEEGGINVSLTRDFFKKNAPVTKMIPASVRFDSVLFNEADRGRPMKELAEAFNAKYPDEVSGDSLSRERYEIVGTFNNWGNWSEIELFRFEKNLTLKLSKGDRFKIHKCCTDCWYGGECIDWEKSVSCMTSVNDNYGGWNIYVCEDGQYKIAFDCGVIRICESEIATAEIHKGKYKYEYEILGTFNRWGGAGNPFDFRFDFEMKVCLHKSDIFKVHKYGTDIWYGYDKLDCDGCIGNFSGVNDNYNGLNIYVKKTGNYNIQIISGKIYISEQ